MTQVTVSRPVLRWALERSRSPKAVERKFPKLSVWLKGESRPTLRQLEAFAKATSTPLGYLFLSEPPEERLPIPFFRTLSDKPLSPPSPQLLETIQTTERRQAWMREYLSEQGYEPLSFVRSVRITDNPENIARKIRVTLGFPEGWARYHPTWTSALGELQQKAEDVGILVVGSSIVGNNTRRKLDLAEFRGFILIDEYAPLVFINRTDAKAAQMFTLTHELAHIWLGRSAVFDLREMQPAKEETEILCDMVAAELLVPAAELRQAWSSILREVEPFQAIARRFKVSELVAARRALDLRLITRDEFLDFYRSYQERERHITKGQVKRNFYATQNLRLGRRFAETVVRAVKEGKIFYRDAYRLTGLYGRTFEQYAKFLFREKL